MYISNIGDNVTFEYTYVYILLNYNSGLHRKYKTWIMASNIEIGMNNFSNSTLSPFSLFLHFILADMIWLYSVHARKSIRKLSIIAFPYHKFQSNLHFQLKFNRIIGFSYKLNKLEIVRHTPPHTRSTSPCKLGHS